MATEDPDKYPRYVLTIAALGFDQGDVVVQGPHTFHLTSTSPKFGLKVDVSHNPTVPPVPNLTITLTKE